MDDQNNQPEQVPQPEQPVQPPPPGEQEQMLSKPMLIGLGALLLLGLIFFFFFYQNAFSTQTEKSIDVTATPDPTIIPQATTKPIPLKTPKPTHTTLYAEDTVSVTLPTGWKDVSTSPLTMSYVSSDFAGNPQNGSITSGAVFSITIAPNTPVMTARERMDLLQNVSPDAEPYYDHQAIGNTYGLYYDTGIAHTYIVANDKYYWTILFQCKDGCTDPIYLNQKQALLNSLIFQTP